MVVELGTPSDNSKEIQRVLTHSGSFQKNLEAQRTVESTNKTALYVCTANHNSLFVRVNELSGIAAEINMSPTNHYPRPGDVVLKVKGREPSLKCSAKWI